MIPRSEVKLSEELRAMEFIEELLHHRDGEFVLHCRCIERPVVDAKAPCTVLLLDEEDRCRKWRCTGPNDALL
jgi:hypothetical protein